MKTKLQEIQDWFASNYWISVLTVIVLAGMTYTVHEGYKLIHPVEFNIRNSAALSPRVMSHFHSREWGIPTSASSVYVYYSRGLFADAYLRFQIDDPKNYEGFKTKLLSEGFVQITSVPRANQKDAGHIKDWWNITSAVSLYKMIYWVFGFDDTNHIVYVLRQGYS